jgi:hypothetical protein
MYFFSVTLSTTEKREVVKLYYSFHVITQKGNTATAILQLSILVNMPTRLRVFFLRRDKYLDLVKCLMKHEGAFPFKSDLLEQVMPSIAA